VLHILERGLELLQRYVFGQVVHSAALCRSQKSSDADKR